MLTHDIVTLKVTGNLMNTISMSQTCLYNISYKTIGNLKDRVHYKLNHNILNRTRYCPNKSALLLMSGHMTVNLHCCYYRSVLGEREKGNP